MLGIGDDWPDRWDTLSHGERKRVQVGAALWLEPDILVLDEPVNHVDGRTRWYILTSLMAYRGIGILVSHDRELLDTVCGSCLFMRRGYTVQRRGNFTECASQQELEDAAREKKYRNALEVYRDMKKRAAMIKQRETGSPGRLSKRNIAPRDHDAKSKIDGARLTGKDKAGARKANVFQRRTALAGAAAESLYFKRREACGITFHGERSRLRCLARIDAGRIPLGPERHLIVPDIEIRPADRIALVGDNGTGKSTLIAAIVSSLRLDDEEVVYIPQEIDRGPWERARAALDSLAEKDLGTVYSIVHRLGSEPDRVRFSNTPSPGEKRKIMLAMGLLKNPSMIIMDEPTNHMDMPSVQRVEEALREYTGALLVASHDPVFVKNTTESTWEITVDGNDTVLRMLSSP